MTRPIGEPRDGRVHHNAHETEQAAAASVHELTGSLRVRTLALLRYCGAYGLTDDEGGQLLARGLGHADRLTFGRRRQELCRAGLVCKSGMTRATPAGRQAIVWIALSDADIEAII